MKNSRGFSVVELVVAVVILGVLLAAMMRMLFQVQDAKESGFQKAEMQANGRAGMEMFAREVRMAGANLPTIYIRAYRGGAPYTISPVVPYPSANNQDSVTIWTAYDNVKVGFEVIGNGTATEIRATDIGYGGAASFKEGDLMILWDTLNNTADMCMVTHVQNSPDHLQQYPSSPYNDPYIDHNHYPNGGVALRLHGISYYIAQDSTAHWVLFRKDGGNAAQGLSDNIKQLNLKYFDYMDQPLSPPYNDTTNSKIRRVDATLQSIPNILVWAKPATWWKLHSSIQLRSL